MKQSAICSYCGKFNEDVWYLVRDYPALAFCDRKCAERWIDQVKERKVADEAERDRSNGLFLVAVAWFAFILIAARIWYTVAG